MDQATINRIKAVKKQFQITDEQSYREKEFLVKAQLKRIFKGSLSSIDLKTKTIVISTLFDHVVPIFILDS